jgi:hypothetical protein
VARDAANDPPPSGFEVDLIATPVDLSGSSLPDHRTQRTNQSTARRAIQILVRSPQSSYREVTSEERAVLSQAFAKLGHVIYGKAFDLVRVEDDIDFTSVDRVAESVERGQLVLIEVKATSLASRDDHFSNHFFSLSTAEVLVAQSLGERFRFAFVHTGRGTFREATLQQILSRAGAIYPSWSIRLDSNAFPD